MDTTAPPPKVIDAGGKAALPGFVDLHYHTAIGKGLLRPTSTCGRSSRRSGTR